MGELPPDQQGKGERQFLSDAAIGNIIGRARSWGPFLPVVIVSANVGFDETRMFLAREPGARFQFSS